MGYAYSIEQGGGGTYHHRTHDHHRTPRRSHRNGNSSDRSKRSHKRSVSMPPPSWYPSYEDFYPSYPDSILPEQYSGGYYAVDSSGQWWLYPEGYQPNFFDASPNQSPNYTYFHSYPTPPSSVMHSPPPSPKVRPPKRRASYSHTIPPTPPTSPPPRPSTDLSALKDEIRSLRAQLHARQEEIDRLTISNKTSLHNYDISKRISRDAVHRLREEQERAERDLKELKKEVRRAKEEHKLSAASKAKWKAKAGEYENQLGIVKEELKALKHEVDYYRRVYEPILIREGYIHE